MKIKFFQKPSRTIDINWAGQGLLITASILTPAFYKNSHLEQYILLCQREKHELYLGVESAAEDV